MPIMQKRCPNGHYYDGDRYSECPYCKNIGEVNKRNDKNNSFDDRNDNPRPELGHTTPVSNDNYFVNGARNQNKTVVLNHIKGTDVSPVVGWLVCTEGGDKGKDFRLHSGNNFVGRNPDRDVCLKGDSSVSGNHFSISYDKRNGRFFIFMGEGKELVYVNDEPLGAASVTLKKGDKIEVAKTTLVFIPLDKEDVQWDWEK